MSGGRLAGVARRLLQGVCVVYALWLVLELQRPDVLIVGSITVDQVEGTTPTGGAVSYAAVVARALGASACIVTVAGPEADLDVFTDSSASSASSASSVSSSGPQLFVLPASETLTFEHSYAWFGHSRRLRVTANPNITITKAHVPWRCRLARVVLLGPLTLHDVDAASFARAAGVLDALVNRRQAVGLLGQGLQRGLGPGGEVVPLPRPSTQLMAALSPRVSLFLSDVETDTWSQQDLTRVVAAAARVLITHGEKGAQLLRAARQRSPAGVTAGAATAAGAAGAAARAAAGAAAGATAGAAAGAGRAISSGQSPDGSSRGGTNGEAGSAAASFASSGIEAVDIPAVKVDAVLDTNGAGDTFAVVYMLALLRGNPMPGAAAAWAASRAVLQPQACKPRCVPARIVWPGLAGAGGAGGAGGADACTAATLAGAGAAPAACSATVMQGVTPISAPERVWLAARPLLRHAAGVVASGLQGMLGWCGAPSRLQQQEVMQQAAEWWQAAARQLGSALPAPLAARWLRFAGGGGSAVGVRVAGQQLRGAGGSTGSGSMQQDALD